MWTQEEIHENRQRTFDESLAHLRKQGRRAVNAGNSPLYCAPDGTKCAIGCFIPPEKYQRSFEALRAHSVVSALPEYVRSTAINFDGGPGVHFLDSLQTNLHDYVIDERFTVSLELGARTFASVWKLEYTPPETASQ